MKNSYVVGVDEVGRGCLLGPVFAAACMIPKDFCFNKYNLKLTDSKKINALQRERIFQKLIKLKKEKKIKIEVGFSLAWEIDKYNIHHASLKAMERAVLKLKLKKAHLLIDGSFELQNLNHYEQTTLIKGDLRAQPISAASIFAKVVRDQLMTFFSENFNSYQIQSHKGYPTKAHKEALEKYGITPEHRRYFSGVKEFLSCES